MVWVGFEAVLIAAGGGEVGRRGRRVLEYTMSTERSDKSVWIWIWIYTSQKPINGYKRDVSDGMDVKRRKSDRTKVRNSIPRSMVQEDGLNAEEQDKQGKFQ